MKNELALSVIVAAGAAVPLASQASDALASRYACMACHTADRKLVGPSWKDIATKYAGGGKDGAALGASIKAGGSGKWGNVPMPAQPTLSDADAKALADWILAKK
jgi:cytochrome c